MNPIALDLGIIHIYWYSIFIYLALFVGGVLALNEGKKHGLEENLLINLFFWLIPTGVLGSRLYYVLFNLSYYRYHLLDIFKVWEGGLAIHGAIIAGALWIIFYTKKHKIKTIKMFDIIVVSLMLGQAIGRWGNFFNQEAYGGEVARSFLTGLHLPKFIIEGMNIYGKYYHPTFLYESLWTLLGFIILILYRRYRYLKLGELTALYLIWYSSGRFWLEYFRLDSLLFYQFRVAQIVSVIFIVIGFILYIISKRGSKLTNLYHKGVDISEERL